MFIFCFRLLVVLLAGALALAFPSRIVPGDLLVTNGKQLNPPGPVSISPNVLD